MRKYNVPDEYFANLEGEEFLDSLNNKIESFYDYLNTQGIAQLIKRSHKAYYGGYLSDEDIDNALFSSAKITQSGARGKYSRYKANHYANVIQHTIQLSSSNRPAVNCRASNTDSKSITQTTLGASLIDFYMREKGLEDHFKDALEKALILFEGWVCPRWNDKGGEFYDKIGEEEIFEGDVEYSTLSLMEVIRDVSASKMSWTILKEKASRWELIEKYPESRDELLSANIDTEINSYTENLDSPDSPDTISVYTFYHEKNNIVSSGRRTIFIKDKILEDTVLPYSEIPAYRLAARRIQGTNLGYTNAVDLLGPQEMLDRLNSTIASNISTFGIQSVWVQSGTDVSVNEISEHLNLIQSETPPQPLQLTKTSPEVYNYRSSVMQDLELLSGNNQTVRGVQQSANQSGAHAALMVSQAVQFASELEGSYTRCIEKVATGTIRMLQDFATTPRIISVVGVSNRSHMKKFSRDDISEINRVVCEIANPMSKSVAGRIELAKLIKETGNDLTPQQLLMLITTGSLESAIEGEQSEAINIKSENESLQNLIQVPVIATDNHVEHIKKHAPILATPEARRNPELVSLVLAHIQDHIDTHRNTDPALLAITGQQPLPAPLPQPGPQNGPSQQEMQQMADTQMMGEPQLPQQPNMPNLPQGAPEQSQEAYQQVQGPIPPQ